MKNLSIVVLAIALAVLAVLHLRSTRSATALHQQQVTASNELVQTLTRLVTVTNELSLAQTEMTAVKSQLAVRTAELEQRTAEKSKAEEQLAQSRQEVAALRTELETIKRTAQEQLAGKTAQIESLQRERQELNQSLQATSQQLGEVRKKFSELEKTHAETLALVDKLRQQVMRLEMENASLQRRLNDLEALREQLRIVKQRLWDMKLAEMKRQNEEGLAKGNRGFIMQGGRWTITAPPSTK